MNLQEEKTKHESLDSLRKENSAKSYTSAKSPTKQERGYLRRYPESLTAPAIHDTVKVSTYQAESGFSSTTTRRTKEVNLDEILSYICGLSPRSHENPTNPTMGFPRELVSSSVLRVNIIDANHSLSSRHPTLETRDKNMNSSYNHPFIADI